MDFGLAGHVEGYEIYWLFLSRIQLVAKPEGRHVFSHMMRPKWFDNFACNFEVFFGCAQHLVSCSLLGRRQLVLNNYALCVLNLSTA